MEPMEPVWIRHWINHDVSKYQMQVDCLYMTVVNCSRLNLNYAYTHDESRIIILILLFVVTAVSLAKKCDLL